MIATFKPGNVDGGKGRWEPALIGGTGQRKTALVSCPKCGTRMTLIHHIIAPDGGVNPSVACTAGACTFLSFIRLEGWKK